jgi:hypothetical protein
MKKNLLSMIVAVFSLMVFGGIEASAQTSDTSKVEVGAQFSFIHFRDLDANDVGIGGRLTYNLNDFFSIDSEVNYYPQDNQNINLFTGLGQGGRKVSVLVGPMVGMRSKRYGIFGKFRVGAMHFSRDLITDFQPGDTDFAFDFGGVFELYPSRHSFVRFDIGDTIFRIPGESVLIGPGQVGTTPAFYSHNLQLEAGIGFRF